MAAKCKIVRANGAVEDVMPRNGKDFTPEEINAIVDGYMELVDMGKEWMVVNEEGKLSNLPFNPVATAVYHSKYPTTNDYIVGDVLVCPKSMIK